MRFILVPASAGAKRRMNMALNEATKKDIAENGSLPQKHPIATAAVVGLVAAAGATAITMAVLPSSDEENLIAGLFSDAGGIIV